LKDHIGERDGSPLIENAAIQGIRATRDCTDRAVVLGQTALDNEVLEHHLGTCVDNLKGAVLQSTGVPLPAPPS
jgi:hypothetical protein